MKKTTLTLAVAAMALTGTTVIAQGQGTKHDPDTNGDGLVTRAEMTAHADQMFARMDANGDGMINADDRAEHRQQRFADSDTNGDGELSQAEMKAMHEQRKERREERRGARAEGREDRMAEHFARMDTDKSGGLSAEELKAGHEARGERRGGEGKGRRGMRGHRGGGMHMLRMADTNNDRTITRAEFDAAIADQFAKTDANGDGQITADEKETRMKAMRETMRAEREATRK